MEKKFNLLTKKPKNGTFLIKLNGSLPLLFFGELPIVYFASI